MVSTSSQVTRTIRIVGATEGVDQATASLGRLATAQGGVAIASETSTKATLSVENALNRMRLSIDGEYRSLVRQAEALKTVTAARQQGLISLAEQNRLLELSASKYSAAGGAFAGMEGALGNIKNIATGFGVLELVNVLTEIPSKILGVVNSIADIGHHADTIGITTRQLQLLDRAAAEFGISTGDMDSALEKFSKSMGQAATGTGVLNSILKANHVAISGNMTTDFERYTKLIAGAADEEQRNYLVTTAFGKSAADLGPVFTKAAEGIGRAAEQNERLGITISDDKIREVEKMRSAYADMATTLGVMFNSAAIDVVAAFAKMSAAATDFLSKLPHENTTTPAGPLTSWARNLVHGWEGTTSPSAGSAPPLHDLNLGNLPLKPTIIPTKPDAAQAALAKQFDSAMASVVKETQAIQDQIATFGMSASAAAAYTKQQQLMDDAVKDHIALTPTLKASINAEATAYGAAAAQLQKMKDAQQAEQFIGQSLFDAAKGATSLSDAFSKLANSIETAVEQALLLGTGPLAGLFGTTSNSGGLLGSLFSFLSPGPMNIVPTAHTGGIVGDLSPSRYVHPAYFDNAPHFSTGGRISDGGVPIIAHPGEGIFTPAQMKALGGGGGSTNVQINVTNNGAPVKATETGRHFDGKKMIVDIVLDTLVSGPADNALAGRFGISPSRRRYS